MDDGLFGGGVGVSFPEAEEAAIRMNPNPKPLNRSGVNRDAMGQSEGLNFRDLHEN